MPNHNMQLTSQQYSIGRYSSCWSCLVVEEMDLRRRFVPLGRSCTIHGTIQCLESDMTALPEDRALRACIHELNSGAADCDPSTPFAFVIVFVVVSTLVLLLSAELGPPSKLCSDPIVNLIPDNMHIVVEINHHDAVLVLERLFRDVIDLSALNQQRHHTICLPGQVLAVLLHTHDTDATAYPSLRGAFEGLQSQHFAHVQGFRAPLSITTRTVSRPHTEQCSWSPNVQDCRQGSFTTPELLWSSSETVRYDMTITRCTNPEPPKWQFHKTLDDQEETDGLTNHKSMGRGGELLSSARKAILAELFIESLVAVILVGWNELFAEAQRMQNCTYSPDVSVGGLDVWALRRMPDKGAPEGWLAAILFPVGNFGAVEVVEPE
ncbi:hypothetical protein PSPO01_12184 [Paraphaeosphaeria sporulosa]